MQPRCASREGENLQPQLDAANADLANEKQANAAFQAQLSKANAATTAAAQVVDLQKQLAAKPDKSAIAADLAQAIQAALANLK